jgi:hypothetical protein
LLERYLGIETATEHRRATLLRLAELEEAPGGRPERAIEQLEAAVELAPNPSASLPDRERLAQLHLRLRSWQKAIQTLQKVVELTAEAPARARLEIRIASIYREGFNDGRAAVEALQRALHHEPVELEALEKLVAYAEQGQVVQTQLDDKIDRALDAARARAVRQPKTPENYLALTRLYGWRADEDARTLAAQAMALARGEAAHERDDSIDPTKELSASGWELLVPETGRSIALEIWRTAYEATMRIYGPSPEALGTGKPERVNQKALPPGWAHLDKIARGLGVGAYELYASRDREACGIGANGDVPIIVAGGAFAERLSPRMRFRLTRKLTLLRDRSGPLEQVDDEELHLFFAACAKVAEVSRPSVLKVTSEGRVDERAKAINKAMSRKERKTLQAIGSRFAILPDPGEWRRSLLEGAARAALVVGGDLVAALSELGLTFGEGRAAALVQFALSDEYQRLRREMGLRP